MASTIQKRLPAHHPSFIAGAIGALVGLGLVIFAGYLFAATSTPVPLNVALIFLGIANLACSALTIRVVRVAWAFAISINGTAALVFLFSAPRLRDAASVSIGLALVPFAVFLAITILHALEADDF